MSQEPVPTPTALPRPPRWWRHPYLRHLRLHFNLLLSPIYLYGLLLGARHAGVSAPLTEPATWWAWTSLHLFLYGGTTALNSYYDRDEGPVGGMLRPPVVDRGLLPFALAVQALGLPLAVRVGPGFAVAWLALFALFAAYSHPAVRLKANPALALGTIALGQGALGFALGWLVLAPSQGLLTARAGLGMASTALVVTGLYLVTQSYQTVEDRRRGDRTLPVLLGPRAALRLAVVLAGAGGVPLLLELARAGGWVAAVPSGVLLAALGASILRWAASFDEADVETNYRRAMRVATVAGTGLTAVLLGLLSGSAG